MRELTLGELRYISESANGWKMDIFMNMSRELTKEEQEQMRSLEEAYVEAFREFYQTALEKDETALSDEIQDAFDETYAVSHPEFYEFPNLLSEKK